MEEDRRKETQDVVQGEVQGWDNVMICFATVPQSKYRSIVLHSNCATVMFVERRLESIVIMGDK